jgi:signal transduction histidine kinase
MKLWEAAYAWWRTNLRRRLVISICLTIALILLGQTLVTLSEEMTAIDHGINSDGRVLAQSVAMASIELMGRSDERPFQHVIKKLGRQIDLVHAAIVDQNGKIVGHSDPSQIGKNGTRYGALSLARPAPGLIELVTGPMEYFVTAPIARGTEVLGFVEMRFRSNEGRKRAFWIIGSTGVMSLFWFVVGGTGAFFFVRRVTRPLGALAQAAADISEGKLDEVSIREPRFLDDVGVLQVSFRKLVEDLKELDTSNRQLLAEQQSMNLHLQECVEEVTADLRQTTNYLRSVFSCIDEGVITVDMDGIIVQANRGAFRHLSGLGWPKKGTPLAGLLADGSELEAGMRRALEEEQKCVLEITAEAKAIVGETAFPVLRGLRELVFRLAPLRSAEGEVLGIVVSVDDQTENRRMEEGVRRSERLISLGTIGAGLAHELGNYMSAIKGFSHLALQQVSEGDPLRPDIEAIHEENSRAVDLLDRFLLFSRKGEVVFHDVVLDDLVRESVDMCRFQLKENGVEFVDELGLGESTIVCDARLIKQVMINLILNASDAMTSREEKILVVHSEPHGDAQVLVQVKDSGTGIAAEHLERSFDPFFTTKDEGTGLGLAISHQIVERHGGALSIESEPGKGTIVSVGLRTAGPKGGKL